MTRLLLAVGVAVLTMDTLALTQPERGGQGPGVQRPGPLPGGRVQRPARDPREQVTGTSIIRGRVVAGDTGTPIRRAQVRAMAGEIRESRIASTDAQGRFELKDLPAARWDLSVSKAGFVTLRYGQRRPFESGMPLEVGEGVTVQRVDFSLPRGAVITGRILDEFGDPVAQARVMVMRYQSFQGTRRLVPVGGMGNGTDDTGAFRVWGLSPGDYYVSATLRGGEMMADASNDTTGYAPTYYPGTGNVAEAQRITVTVGQEHPNVSFALLPTRTVKITGTAVDSKGAPITNGMVMLQESMDNAAGGMMMMMRPGGRIRPPDGSFNITNVSPGSYTVVVNSGMGGGDDNETASVPITVGNEDLSGINLVTSRGATLSGVVMAAEGSTSQLRTDGLQVMGQPARAEPMMMGMRPGRVENDGTFTTKGLAGRRLVRLNGLPPTWTLKAVMLNGSDITDTPIEFKGTEEVSGVQVLVTDRVAEVNGKVATDKGEPTRDYTVIVFPEDSDKWAYPSRSVRSGRADQQGLFKIRGLPPEQRYLAIAVDWLEEGEGGDPQFLEQMKDRATKFSLGEGDVRALDLKLVVR